MIQKLFSSRLRINMISGAVTHAASALVLMLTYPVYLHFLGYETYGLWVTLGTVLVFAQLGDLGIRSAMMKLVAEEKGRGNVHGIGQHIFMSSLILTCTGSVIFAVILIFGEPIIGLLKLREEKAEMARWLLPYIGALSVYVLIVQTQASALSGLGRMDIENYLRVAGRFLTLAISVPLLMLDFGLKALLIGSCASYVAMHAASLFLIHRIVPVHIFRLSNLDRACLKRLLGFGSGVVAGKFLNMLIDPFNKIMLTRFAGLETTPLYDMAFRGSRQIRSLIETSLRALMPEISKLHASTAEGARKRISRLNRRACWAAFAVGGAFYVPIFLLVPYVLPIWLGADYKPELLLPFRIILVGTFISLMGTPAYYLLLGVGKVFSTLWGLLIVSVTNVTVVTILVQSTHNLTVAQVAYSLLAGWTLSTVFLLWKTRKFLLAAQVRA